MPSASLRKRFGERVRALRKKKGWTQVEMADYLGLDRSYVSQIENGKRNITLDTLDIMARGLGVSLSKLFSKL